jgi:hypothetical protein
MANYLLVYHGGGASEMTPEQQAGVMEAWTNWFSSFGSAVVDGGNPVGRNWSVNASGTTEDGGANPATGYSVIKADSMQAALDATKGCPIIAGGGTVEICETFNVG